MIFGNLVALRQTNIVRMLAYSSIAQGGFILVPLAVAGDGQARGRVASKRVRHLPPHLRAMNLGAFAVVIAVARAHRSAEIDVVRRARSDVARARGGDDDLPVLAGRHPAARGLVRQVRDVPRRARRQYTVGAIVLGVIAARRVGDRVLLLRRGGSGDVVPRPGARGTTASRPIPAALTVAIGLCAAVTIVVGIYPQFFAKVGELAFLIRSLTARARYPPARWFVLCGAGYPLRGRSLTCGRSLAGEPSRGQSSSVRLAGDEVRHPRHGERDQAVLRRVDEALRDQVARGRAE